jgi:hypothetical protein
MNANPIQLKLIQLKSKKIKKKCRIYLLLGFALDFGFGFALDFGFGFALDFGFVFPFFTALLGPPPILNILVPQTEHVPLIAGLPFFIVTCCSPLIGLFALHFTQ